MRCLIHEVASAVGLGALDVAGRPLVVRQLQWLRAIGIEEVIVEVASGPHDSERGALLLSADPLFAQVTVVPSDLPLGVETLAARAGVAADELFLALPASLLAQVACPLPSAVTTVSVSATSSPGSPATLHFRTRNSVEGDELTSQEGWALELRDLATAHAVSCAVLAGELSGPLVHAAEVRPGVWIGRSARVAEDATLIAPVLVGADARVVGNARIGPNVVLGPGALVERESALSEVSVRAGVLIGESSRIRQALVDERGITSLADGARSSVHDPLFLSRVAAPSSSPGGRVVALLLALLLVVPWALVAGAYALVRRSPVQRVRFDARDLHLGSVGLRTLDLMPSLIDVLLGRCDLLGVPLARALALSPSEPDAGLRIGAIDLSVALAPSGDRPTLLAMWRWYTAHKSAGVDIELLVRSWWRAARTR